MGKRSNERANHPKQRYHYVACDDCESNFRLPRGESAVPAHRCWARERSVRVMCEAFAAIGASDVR